MKKNKIAAFSPPFFSAQQGDNHHAFHQQLGLLLFSRLRLVCLIAVCSYPFYLTLDVYFLRVGDNQFNWAILSFMHFISFFVSLLFLVFRSSLMNRSKTNSQHLLKYVYFFFGFYILIGSSGSLNSQFLTDNIYSYLILLMATAIIFPIPPEQSAVIIGAIHCFFLAGLFMIEGFSLPAIVDMINSSAAAGISVFLSSTFYFYRKKESENHLQLFENEKTFRRLFDMNPHPLILARLSDHQVVLLNQRASDYYEGTGLSEKGIDLFFKDSHELRTIVDVLKEKNSIKGYLTPHFDPLKPNIWIMLNFEIVDHFQEPCLLIGTTDVTTFKAEEEKLSAHAFVDELTGTMSRRKGLNILSSLMNSRHSQSFTICYIDIDHLKKVNDQHGHNKGDQLIKTISGIIQKKINDDDILFRMGGDEFVIIFPGQTPSKANQVWSAIQKEFKRMNQTSQEPFTLSASHGTCYYQSGMNVSVEELLEMADQQMYNEKRESRQ